MRFNPDAFSDRAFSRVVRHLHSGLTRADWRPDPHTAATLAARRRLAALAVRATDPADTVRVCAVVMCAIVAMLVFGVILIGSVR